jgi:nucleoid-associated protein YgaU
VPAEKPAEKPVEKPAEPIAKEGWVHTVERGQSVGTILDAYRKEYGLKTSLDDLRKANPNIRNLNLVRPGQDIIIPDIR